MNIQTATVAGKEVRVAICERPACGHQWLTKTPRPKSCPKCKQYQ